MKETEAMRQYKGKTDPRARAPLAVLLAQLVVVAVRRGLLDRGGGGRLERRGGRERHPLV